MLTLKIAVSCASASGENPPAGATQGACFDRRALRHDGRCTSRPKSKDKRHILRRPMQIPMLLWATTRMHCRRKPHGLAEERHDEDRRVGVGSLDPAVDDLAARGGARTARSPSRADLPRGPPQWGACRSIRALPRIGPPQERRSIAHLCRKQQGSDSDGGPTPQCELHVLLKLRG